MGEPQRVLVGVLGAAQGVRGEVRVKSYTAVATAIADYGPLWSEDGRRSFTVTALRPLRDDMLVARIVGLTDRDGAAALTGTKLYVDRASLPPPDEDEFYQIDLLGLLAEDEAGQALGRVAAVQNFGAGDLLAIAPSVGDTLLVPFTKAFVPILDFEGGRLVVAAGALLTGDEAEHPVPPAEEA